MVGEESANRFACTVQVFGQHNRRVGNGLLLTECRVFGRRYWIIKCWARRGAAVASGIGRCWCGDGKAVGGRGEGRHRSLVHGSCRCCTDRCTCLRQKLGRSTRCFPLAAEHPNLAEAAMPHAPCAMSHAPCSVPHASCPMAHALHPRPSHHQRYGSP